MSIERWVGFGSDEWQWVDLDDAPPIRDALSDEEIIERGKIRWTVEARHEPSGQTAAGIGDTLADARRAAREALLIHLEIVGGG